MLSRILILCFLVVWPSVVQPQVPFEFKQSSEFKSPKRHDALRPIPFGDKGILQLNVKGNKSFHFQWFTNDLKFAKEKTIKTSDLLGENPKNPTFLKIKDKAYLFVRNVYKESKTEGISYLEFDEEKLEFGSRKNLLNTSNRVRYNVAQFVPVFFAEDSNYNFGEYKLGISKSEKTIAFTYRIRRQVFNDKVNKDTVGLQVFDHSLNKLWSAEVSMPYPEAKMDNLSFMVSDDAKVYMLAKVYLGNSSFDGFSFTKPNFKYIVLIYEKDNPNPEIIEVDLDEKMTRTVFLYETPNGSIVLAGFYAKTFLKPIKGVFALWLNTANKNVSLKNASIMEVPDSLIKSNSSKRELLKMEIVQDVKDEIPLKYLEARRSHVFNDRIIFSTEIYEGTYSSINVKARDIYVLCTSMNGNNWARKISKEQIIVNTFGGQASFNSLVLNDKIYYFFLDNIKNINRVDGQAPSRFILRDNAHLACMSYDLEGAETKYSLGELDMNDAYYYIRHFVPGNNKSLIFTSQKDNANTLMSIQQK